MGKPISVLSIRLLQTIDRLDSRMEGRKKGLEGLVIGLLACSCCTNYIPEFAKLLLDQADLLNDVSG